jgi:hypothetical protein
MKSAIVTTITTIDQGSDDLGIETFTGHFGVLQRREVKILDAEYSHAKVKGTKSVGGGLAGRLSELVLVAKLTFYKSHTTMKLGDLFAWA